MAMGSSPTSPMLKELMAIFLGIDGGATKTACVIADENSVLGTGGAAGCNLTRVNETVAREALANAIGEACAAARVTPGQISRTCIGVAGAGRPQIQEKLRRILGGVVGGEIEVVEDMVIALEAAFGGDPGVVTIAGTGSIAYGRNAAGQSARAGGWGFAISDEGSGYWIGRTAVSALMRARDEQEVAAENSPLLAGILKSWELQNVEQLILAANATPARDFAALFPVVLAAGDSGDPVAQDVLQGAGTELALLARVVGAQLFRDAASVPVAMSGGVFTNSVRVREAFQERLRAELPAVTVREEMVAPVYGALARAHRRRPATFRQ